MHSPVEKLTSFSTIQEILLILCDQRIHILIYNSPTFVPILSQINPHSTLSNLIHYDSFINQIKTNKLLQFPLPILSQINPHYALQFNSLRFSHQKIKTDKLLQFPLPILSQINPLYVIQFNSLRFIHQSN